ncbi:MAG: AAA family ATPase, partial [Bacilli bacterium]
MFLSRLKLKNFRNFSDLNLKFNKNINIFIGNNAQGKTNILESIYFLSIVRSHRTNNDLNLIKEKSLYMKIDASVIYNENSKNFSILLNEKGKKVMINNLVQKKLSNYLSNLNVIIFCPDDLEIVKGTPSIRRRFLNI